MHHGCHDEGQRVAASAEGRAFAHGLQTAFDVHIKELPYHVRRLGVGDNGHFGMAQQQVFHQGAVVGFHVVHHKVVQFASGQNGFDVLKELPAYSRVGRVE